MSLKNKVVPSVNDFLTLIFSNNKDFSLGGLYNAFSKLEDISYLKPEELEKYSVKTIPKEDWTNSLFITLPVLGWTVVLVPSYDTIYDIRIIHHRFINDINTYGRNSIYFTYFLSSDICLSTELYVADNDYAAAFDTNSNLYEILRLYTSVLYLFVCSLLASNNVIFTKIENKNIKYMVNAKDVWG